MNPKPDPLGESLEAYLNGNANATIKVISNIAPDDLIPVSYLFRNYEDMPKLEQEALKLCKGKILDAGAGAGSHSLWLQEQKFDITALDISEKAVAVMKKRGLKNAIQGNIWEFHPSGKFDTILLLMNGIGLAGTLAELETFLRLLASFLNPGGKILLESADILYMFEEEDGSVLLDLNAGYYGEVQYQMEFNNRKGPSFPWLFVDFPMLADYAGMAGLDAEIIYEGNEGQYLARLRPMH